MSYTYLIGWSLQDKWYYGSRYSKKSSPKDLWVTYFTSSKYVKEMRQKYGEPDVIEVRRVFDDPVKAQLWEQKVLKRMNVLYEDRWLNKNVGGRIYLEKQSEEHIKKRTSNKKHNPNQKEFALKASKVAIEKRRGSKDSEDTKRKRNETLKETFRRQSELGIERSPRKKFMIEGVIYDGLKSVMEAFSISMPTVYNRIKSDKFKDWSYYGN